MAAVLDNARDATPQPAMKPATTMDAVITALLTTAQQTQKLAALIAITTHAAHSLVMQLTALTRLTAQVLANKTDAAMLDMPLLLLLLLSSFAWHSFSEYFDMK